jgi:hypothetical protein
MRNGAAAAAGPDAISERRGSLDRNYATRGRERERALGIGIVDLDLKLLVGVGDVDAGRLVAVGDHEVAVRGLVHERPGLVGLFLERCLDVGERVRADGEERSGPVANVRLQPPQTPQRPSSFA